MSAEDRWWPSPFGAEDQLGMLNHITDAKRRQAMELVREGRVYDLGRVLDEHVPVFPGRYFRQTLEPRLDDPLHAAARARAPDRQRLPRVLVLGSPVRLPPVGGPR